MNSEEDSLNKGITVGNLPVIGKIIGNSYLKGAIYAFPTNILISKRKQLWITRSADSSLQMLAPLIITFKCLF